MRANDALTGTVLILFAGIMLALTASFPAFPGQRYGPALFPRILGTGLIVCGAILVWRGVAARRAGERLITFADWTGRPGNAFAFALILGSILLYIFTSETVGFIPVAVVILAVLFLWFGVRWVVAIPTALVATWAIHWFFASAMRVPLPRGWLDNVL
jgi:putative tricarboxylic transport membrane protein